MKTLIITLLLAACAWGQDAKMPQVIYPAYPGMQASGWGHSITDLVGREVIKQSALQLDLYDKFIPYGHKSPSGHVPALVERTYKDSTQVLRGTYVIEFEYDLYTPFKEIDCDSKQTHYPALITVSMLLGKERILVGRSFPGIFTEKECKENNSKELVDEAWTQKPAVSLIPNYTPFASNQTIPEINRHSLVRGLLDLLDEYSEYCYDDSTKQVHYYGMTITNGYGRIVSETISDSAIYYTHKQPTFPGFKEWLRGMK